MAALVELSVNIAVVITVGVVVGAADVLGITSLHARGNKDQSKHL